MKLTIHTSDGAELTWADFESGTALDLSETLADDTAPAFLAFEMDEATVIVNRDHIVRLDIEP